MWYVSDSDCSNEEPGLTYGQEKKLVDVAMKTAWYVLVGEEDVDESDCTMTGAYYLEAKSGEYRCFYMTRPSDSHDCGDDDPSTVCVPPYSRISAANTQ